MHWLTARVLSWGMLQQQMPAATDPVGHGLVRGDLVNAVQALEGAGQVDALVADWGPRGVVLQLGLDGGVLVPVQLAEAGHPGAALLTHGGAVHYKHLGDRK